MKEKIFSSLTKFVFIVFLLCVPFSFIYSLSFLEKNKSFTSFSLYNIYLLDLAAIGLIVLAFINLSWHKKSFLALLFAFFALISSFWSGSPLLSFIGGLRMVIIVLALGITISLVKKSENYQNIFLKTLIATGIIQSFIALGQFILGKSLGLYLLGESHLGNGVLGLARINILNHDFLRAYGTFPHPNVLGGYLLFTLAITFLYKSAKYKYLLLFIQLVGLGLTFSRTAILGFLIMCFFTIVSSSRRWGSRFFLDSRFHGNDSGKKRVGLISKKGIATTILIIIFSLSLFRSPIQSILSGRDKGINMRIEYAKAAIARLADSPILGRGWGTGPIELPAFSTFPFYSWELQPVHNIYLLVLSDLGIAGLLILIYFIYRVATGPHNIWKYLFITFLFIGLVDHYLLTLPQGIFIFWGSAFLVYTQLQKKEKIL